jgi:hypothetical protein
MKVFLVHSVWPVIASIVTAFIVMLAFEFTNAMMYPFPAELDVNNIEQVKEFASTLPFFAFLMVLLGWMCGSFAAGVIVTLLTKHNLHHGRRLTILVGIVLTLLGLFNNFVFLPGVQPIWLVTIGTVTFMIFSYLGHHVFASQFSKGRPTMPETPLYS